MINRAIQEAKKRDGWKCRVCGGVPVDGAHLLPRNHPAPEYSPDSSVWIVTLCRQHHTQYDANKRMQDKASWLKYHGLRREYDLIWPLVEGWRK